MTGTGPWTLRPETPSDLPGIRAVHRAAFGRQDEADLVDRLRVDPSWLPGLSLVACGPASGTADGEPPSGEIADDEVVGHVLLTRCHIGESPALCLAPCGVLPALQGRGVGSALIRRVLDIAQQQGERAVVVLGHPGYYPRFGFRPAMPRGIRLTVDVPPEALMIRMLAETAPVPSGVVRYAEPFGIPAD